MDILEQFRITPEDMLPFMQNGSEIYALNTCNRTEVYWINIDDLTIVEMLSRISGVENERITELAEIFRGKEAVEHLFMVAAGLDSLVIGEPQILGQIKDAYRAAVAANTSSTLMNKVLHRTFRSAKRIRTETDIGRYPVSIASEAVELATHIFGDIKKSKALIIGAGDMAGIAGKRLQERGATNICVINRTYKRACDLATELGGIPKTFDCLVDELTHSDIVICSTGSSEPIINNPVMENVMHARRNSPIILIDIALPRDVDPDVGKLYNCYLYDIDSLKSIVNRHITSRELQAEKAREIIEYELGVLEKWFTSLDANSTIKDLFDLMEDTIDNLLADMNGSEQERKIMEQSLRLSLKRLLHRPVSFLREHPSMKHIDAVRRIFQLDENNQDRHKRQ
ncbi:MAG: glutamyl-tRNA reductase [Deltaproteobacteria bacterium]|nr:glutamyl-tRNA reductase [Deltaproteobacteria bacterium]